MLGDATDDEKAKAHYKYDLPAIARLKYLLNFSLPTAVYDSIVTEMFDETFPGGEKAVSRQLYMTPEQIRQLGSQRQHRQPWHEHLPLGLLTETEIEKQIAGAAETLCDWAGYRPYALSYPYGSLEACSPAAAAIASAQGVGFTFTMERAGNPDLSRPLHLARFDNNDMPGGKAAHWEIGDLFERPPAAEWFAAADVASSRRQ